jgi:ribosomal protein S18 acetylase RimI-like enzyme
MGTHPAARLAARADVPGMADALAAAFHDDPVMCWLFGQKPPRPQRYARPFFESEARRHLAHPTVYTTDDHAGAAFWDPPGEWKTPITAVLRQAPLLLRGIQHRTVGAMRGLARIEKAHAQHPEHYYLAVLGTRPDRQGEGLGAALLSPVLSTCDEEGIGAYLESSKEANIPYYRRFGFEVVGEVAFPGGPSLWPMWRDPQAPAADAG